MAENTCLHLVNSVCIKIHPTLTECALKFIPHKISIQNDSEYSPIKQKHDQ